MMKSVVALLLLAVCVYEIAAITPISRYTRRPMPGLETAETRAARRERVKSIYTYDTLWFDARLDNFGWGSNATWKLQVLYSDADWKQDGPILFYAGNEGEIEKFLENSGQLWDLAPELKGLVVFAEHRYYGKSMPFGDEKTSYGSRENLAFFTADQAMADYIMLIEHLKSPAFEGGKGANSKTIVFGGSYGGMLGSWMRMKYPNIIDGTIASSAPIWSFTWPCESYARVATQDFEKVSMTCRNNIAASWEAVNTMANTTEGVAKLAEIFNTCEESFNGTDVKTWLENAFATVAMVNYPYPTEFLAPLPAWPITRMCEDSGLMDDLTGDDEKLLGAVYQAASVYYNYTGNAGSCNNISSAGEEQELGIHGWDFQTCTEMTIPFCNKGGDVDMFEPAEWSDEEWAADCRKKWFGVEPNLAWTKASYWDKNIESASNILFSNGLLDPWSAGGVMKSLSPYQPIVIIPDGAHHLELRAKTEFDTPSCKAAREVQTAWIRRWIGENPTKVASQD